MTAVVVGPVPTIRFVDGTRQAYDPPRNTLDIRYAACTDHHPACDCREAEISETFGEFRGERDALTKAFATELADHATWPPYGESRDRAFQVCSCTGCRIARAVYWPRTPLDTERDRRGCCPVPPANLDANPDEVPF